MATQVAPLSLRLFLEGIEIPCISSQVNIQPGQPAAAAIQIIPLDSGLILLPRTLVHLFYLDSELTEEDRRIADNVEQRTGINRFDAADERYRLMFAGEVIGLQYNKQPSSRSLVLQAMDHSIYWDTCYQWFADYSVGGNGLTDRTHNFVGARRGLFDNVASGTRWVIGNLLNSKPANPEYSNAEGLLAGIIHLLESIGGLRPKAGATYKSFRGVNDFFTIAELRYNLTGMIGAVEADKTSQRMYANKAFINWLQHGMTSAGSLISYRDVLKLLGQYIFHDVYPNPAPFFVQGGETVIQRIPRTYVETSFGSQITSGLNDANTKINGVIETLNGLAVDPETVKFGDSTTPLRDAFDGLRAAEESLITGGSADRAKVSGFVREALNNLDKGRLLFQNLVKDNANREWIMPLNVRDGIVSFLEIAVSRLEAILQAKTVRRTVESVETTTSDHLYTQLILPETFFVVPPRCNVMFPDMYMSLSYSRNFLREVTRLSCQGGLGMIAGGSRGAQIFGRYYVAPNVKTVRGVYASKSLFSASGDILPHERHTGIVPKFEWVTDGHRWGVNAAKERGTSARDTKIAYIQRLANFQFFIHRWKSRTMQVQGRFNPHLVVGFPGVVIDRSSPTVSTLLTLSQGSALNRMILPNAFVGKVASIVHNVNQGGGMTTVSYTHCRTHRGIDDEFLGVVQRENKETSEEVIYTANVQTLLDKIQQNETLTTDEETALFFFRIWAEARIDIGQKNNIGTVRKVDVSDDEIEVSAAELQILGVSANGISNLRTLTDLEDVQDLNNVLVAEFVEFTIQVRPDLGKFVSAEGAAPFEDIVRPGWYAPDVWDNDNISEKVYLPLLGSRSIVDDEAVGDIDNFADILTAAVQDAGRQDQPVTTERNSDGSIEIRVGGELVATFGFNVENGTTTETAIDALTLTYGLLKKRNLDVQRFISDYVKRPIATLPEVLGDQDFEIAREGNSQGLQPGDAVPRADGSTPVEGFHSRAFGPYNIDVQFRLDTSENAPPPVDGADALLGLIPADKVDEFNKAGTIINRGARSEVPVPKNLDPRGRAWERVRIYANELAATRGISAS